jgi:hypothetical protein
MPPARRGDDKDFFHEGFLVAYFVKRSFGRAIRTKMPDTDVPASRPKRKGRKKPEDDSVTAFA